MVTSELIERPQYTDWLQRWKDRDVIKVITGLRRCGKSMVLELFRRSLVAEGIAESRIISINFESLDAHYQPITSLYTITSLRDCSRTAPTMFFSTKYSTSNISKKLRTDCTCVMTSICISPDRTQICFPANWQHSSPDDMSNLRCCHCLSRNTEMHCNQQQMTMRCSTGISHMEDSLRHAAHRRSGHRRLFGRRVQHHSCSGHRTAEPPYGYAGIQRCSCIPRRQCR